MEDKGVWDGHRYSSEVDKLPGNGDKEIKDIQAQLTWG